MTVELKRKIEGVTALVLSTAAALFGLFWLVFILGDVLVNGISALNFDLFLNDPAPAGVDGGGLRNAFTGQLMITFFATLIGVPIGVLGGTFLAEYARGKALARTIGILSDIMVSVPSIVIGTFVYALVVRPLGHFNGWAGAIALAISWSRLSLEQPRTC
jgi:phosphate transport system permease protein